jgi:Flp pilus assembly protein TadG
MNAGARPDERGSAMVEAPFCIAVVLLLMMGIVTLVQVVWTHLDLADAVRDTTRYAARVEYDPSAVPAGSSRHRTAAEVKAWAESMAAESGIHAADVAVTTSSGAPLESLHAGDLVTITITTTVHNPLYRMAANTTNAMAGLLHVGQPFNPDGVPIKAEAETYVE